MSIPDASEPYAALIEPLAAAWRGGAKIVATRRAEMRYDDVLQNAMAN